MWDRVLICDQCHPVILLSLDESFHQYVKLNNLCDVISCHKFYGIKVLNELVQSLAMHVYDGLGKSQPGLSFLAEYAGIATAVYLMRMTRRGRLTLPRAK